jgi:hypothetical protein
MKQFLLKAVLPAFFEIWRETSQDLASDPARAVSDMFGNPCSLTGFSRFVWGICRLVVGRRRSAAPQVETLDRLARAHSGVAADGIRVMPSVKATRLRTPHTALMCMVHQVQGGKRSSARLCRVREGNNLLVQSSRRTLEIWQNSREQRYRVDIDQWIR